MNSSYRAYILTYHKQRYAVPLIHAIIYVIESIERICSNIGTNHYHTHYHAHKKIHFTRLISLSFYLPLVSFKTTYSLRTIVSCNSRRRILSNCILRHRILHIHVDLSQDVGCLIVHAIVQSSEASKGYA